MQTLDDVLPQLITFLRERTTPPSSHGLKLFNLNKHLKGNRKGKLEVSRTDLVAPDEFAAQFDALVASNPAWIHVSCFGLFEGDLVIGFASAAPSARRAQPTSINYSGPPRIVLEHGWDATRFLLIH